MNRFINEKSGFTLFEFFMSLVILAVIFGIAVPIILYVISMVRINAFKNDAYNVLEAVKIHVATTNFDTIPDEGIEISKLNIELKNNNFDGGIVKKIGTDKFEIVNLRKANYCAYGTTDNMKATDKGCGALDQTKPLSPHIYIKSVDEGLTLIATATDLESNIVGYEFSIDNSKYTTKSSSNEYTFKNIKNGTHKVKVRVTNEAGLKTSSSIVEINIDTYKNITCYEKNDLELYQSKKNIVCKYPSGKDYIYEYSIDNKNWTKIDLKNNLYEFNFTDNKTIYTRVVFKNKVISFNTINVLNIDNTLNDAYPNLLDNMIPVIYDSDKKAWLKADSRLKYFDYDNKIWANAVFVRRVKDTDDALSNNRDYYLSDKAIGKEIYSKDIVAHFVWIPRFKYNIFNLSNIKKDPILIDVMFENKNTEVSDGKKVGEFITHKAFMYNDGVNGFWVSKYQMSVAETSSCYNDINSCNKDDLILYGVESNKKLTNISISNAHLNAKNMNQANNIYGMSKDVDSHVLTNLEYGAILYLTNSKYGIGNNYYLSSTTGNMTGVFDLNSTYPEMVMGNYNKDSGKSKTDNSGFESYGSVKWPDIIDYYNGITSKNRIIGDATGETNNWYGGYAKFVNGENPFFIRGGVMDNKASIYNYSSFTGNKNELYTFRTVLTK